MTELREWGFLIFHTLELRGSTSRMASCSVSNSVSVATKPTPANMKALCQTLLDVFLFPAQLVKDNLCSHDEINRRLLLDRKLLPGCEVLTIGVVWAQGHCAAVDLHGNGAYP